MNPAPNSDETLFADALARPPAERAAFLDRACAGDPARRERLDALLRAAAAASEGFMAAATASLPSIPREPAAGTVIGRYKLLQKLGEGGCGIVYMAEQEEPVRRRVALKVIKLGMDTKEVVARFEAERQALALMEHPNIARVFDGGATEQGRPFFVMELVRGVPITKYCDEQNLRTTARLELFIQEAAISTCGQRLLSLRHGIAVVVLSCIATISVLVWLVPHVSRDRAVPIAMISAAAKQFFDHVAHGDSMSRRAHETSRDPSGTATSDWRATQGRLAKHREPEWRL